MFDGYIAFYDVVKDLVLELTGLSQSQILYLWRKGENLDVILCFKAW